MGKHNNNFEYYKPQNGSREGLIMPSDSDSDCKDSDSKAMFTLPKRKFVRKKGGRRKHGLCCRDICNALLPFVIALFIIGTLVSIGYIMLGVNGMRREIELLKIQLNKVQSDEQSDLLQSKAIQSSLKGKLSSLSQDEKEIADLKSKIKSLSYQLKLLNSTISQMKSEKDPSSVPKTINQDLALLKKGMADTGGEIKKLSDESEGAKKTLTVLSKIIKILKNDVSKLKDTVSDFDGGAIPTKPVDTLKPFVPTTSPVDKMNEEKHSLKKIAALVKKVVNGYHELFKNKTDQLNTEFTQLRANVKKINETVKLNFISVQNTVRSLQNLTNQQKGNIDTLTARLDSATIDTVNASSNNEVLRLVQGILTDLKEHQKIIGNLTLRVSTMEEKKEGKEIPKREEVPVEGHEGSGMATTEQPDEIQPTKQAETEKPVTSTTVVTPTESAKNSSKNEPSVELPTNDTSVTKDFSPTTLKPDLEKTEAVTTLAHSTSHAGGSVLTRSNTSDTASKRPPGMPASTSQPNATEITRTVDGENISHIIETSTPTLKPKKNHTIPPSDLKLTSPSTNIMNVNLTAENVGTTGKPIVTSANEHPSKPKTTAETLPEEPSFGEDGLSNNEENKKHPKHLKSDDTKEDSFDAGMSLDSARTASRGLDSNKNRSKHEFGDSDDGFDALDQLDTV